MNPREKQSRVKNPEKFQENLKKTLVFPVELWYPKPCDSHYTHPGILCLPCAEKAAWAHAEPGGGKNERMI